MQTITESRTPVRKEALARPPLFVLSAAHSLSSLLCAALGQHPELYATPGLHLLGGADLGASITLAREERPAQLHGLVRTIADLYSSEQTVESIEMARRWLRRRESLPADEVYRELCQKVAPRILIERHTVHAGRAGILECMDGAFPDARYVFLVRHPFAQGKAALGDLHSVKRLMHEQRPESAAPARDLDPQFAWFDSQITILEFLETIPKEKQSHLRIEDIAENPAPAIGELCEWLGASWNSEMLPASTAIERSPFYGPGPFNAISGYDPAIRRLVPWGPLPVEPPLDGALPWQKNAGLAPQVLELAQALGYGTAPAL